MTDKGSAISTNKTSSKVIAVILAALICVAFMPMLSGTAYAAGKKPAKVKSLTVSVDKDNKVSLKWKKAKNAKKYEVSVKDGSSALVAAKKVKKVKYSFKGQPNTKYTIKVRGIKGKKKGKWSAKKTVTTNANSAVEKAKAAEAAQKKAEAAQKAAEAKAEAAQKAAETAQKAAEAKAEKAAKEAAEAKAVAEKEKADKEAAEAAAKEAQVAAEKAKKELADANAALDMVNRIVDVDYDTPAQDIVDLKAEYDALSDAVKAKIPEPLVEKLNDFADDAQTQIDKEKAAEVTRMIQALPNPEDVAVDSGDQIRAARAAYDELSDAQKEIVGKEVAEKLEACEAAFEEISGTKEAADRVAEMINALPAADQITSADKEAVDAAYKAYNNDLNDKGREFIDKETKTKLEDCVKALDKAIDDENKEAAAAVDEMIGRLPKVVNASDAAAVKEALDAYNALNDEAKDYVKNDDKLVGAIEDALGEDVVDAFDALPDAEDVTTEDAEKIAAARTAYDAMSADQKALAEESGFASEEKLVAAEKALEKAKKNEEDFEAAWDVLEMIENLDEEATPIEDSAEIAKDVEDARAAYNELTDDQKALVNEFNEDAVATLEAVEDAYNVTVKIEKLPAPEDVTAEDETEINSAKNDMNEDIEKYVSEGNVEKLNNCIDALRDAKAKDEFMALLADAPKAVESKEDADKVEALMEAYGDMSDADQENLSVDDQKKYDDAVDALEAYDKVESVKGLIDALEDADKVTVVNYEEVGNEAEAARSAYEDLDEELQNKVDNIEKLGAVEDAVGYATEAAAINERIDGLSENIDTAGKAYYVMDVYDEYQDAAPEVQALVTKKDELDSAANAAGEYLSNFIYTQASDIADQLNDETTAEEAESIIDQCNDLLDGDIAIYEDYENDPFTPLNPALSTDKLNEIIQQCEEIIAGE